MASTPQPPTRAATSEPGRRLGAARQGLRLFVRRPATGPRAKRRQRPAEQGSATVEFAIGLPMLVLLLAFAVQGGIWAIGNLSARQAATHAAQTARIIGGTAAAGHADATELLNQLPGDLITDPRITVTRTPTTTTVIITGTAKSLTGLRLPVRVRVESPTERYTQPLAMPKPAPSPSDARREGPR